MRFLLILASFLIISAAYAESARVGVVRNLNFPPYTWWDDDRQQQSGFRHSVEEKILAELGIAVTHVDIDAPNTQNHLFLIENLKTGNLNFALMSEDVARSLSFVHMLDTPVTSIELRVFVHSDRVFNFSQWSDLKGRRGLIQGFPNEPVSTTEAFESYVKSAALNIKRVGSLQAVVSALEKGEADYLISVYRPALIQLWKSGKQDTIIALDTPIDSVSLHWVIPKNSPLINRADDIEALLKRYKEQGRLDFKMKEAMRSYLITTE